MKIAKLKLIFKKEFWKRVGFEIYNFFRKFSLTVQILRPNERRILLILSIVILVSATLLFRNYYLTLTTTNPQKGGVYAEGVVGIPKFLNPVLAKSDIDRDISTMIFASLVSYNEKGEVVPYLAKKFQISEDQKAYSFELDPRILWQDGEKVTSDDVDFTLKLLTDTGYNGPFADAFSGIKFTKISDSEFSISIPETNSSFVSTLAQVGILPVHKLKDVKPSALDKNDFNLDPVGCGRYRLDKNKSKLSGSIQVVLARAQTYGKDDGGYLDEVIFRPYSSDADILEAYKKGEINGFGGFSMGEIDGIDKKLFRVNRVQIPRFSAAFFNLDNPNLKELKFRLALAHAVDKTKIVNDVYQREAEILDSPIPSFAPGYNPEVKQYPFDPGLSAKYLDELGFIDSDKDGIREKDGQKIELTLVTTDDPMLQAIAQILKGEWEKIGVKTNLEIVDLLTLQKDIIPSGNYDAIVLGVNLGFPPDPYQYFHSSEIKNGLNISSYKNLEVDRLLEEVRQTGNLELRGIDLRKFSAIVAQDLPAVFIADAPYLYGSNSVIKGIPKVRIGETSSDRFLSISSWYVKSERKKK